jgi:polar amino acid transport system permease protein
MGEFKFRILIDAYPLLLEGLLVTMIISMLAFVFALFVGIVVGISRSSSKRLRRLLAPYVEIFRGTPLLIQLFFIYYGLPSLGLKMNNYTAGVIGLGLNGGAYISEIIRGALYSVERGQQEAAYSLGLNWLQSMTYVISPQAIRVAIPPLVNSFSATIKESSLVSVLAITELTRVSQLIYTRTFRAFEVYLAAGALYFFMIYLASYMSKYLERKFHVEGRISL